MAWRARTNKGRLSTSYCLWVSSTSCTSSSIIIQSLRVCLSVCGLLFCRRLVGGVCARRFHVFVENSFVFSTISLCIIFTCRGTVLTRPSFHFFSSFSIHSLTTSLAFAHTHSLDSTRSLHTHTHTHTHIIHSGPFKLPRFMLTLRASLPAHPTGWTVPE